MIGDLNPPRHSVPHFTDEELKWIEKSAHTTVRNSVGMAFQDDQARALAVAVRDKAREALDFRKENRAT